MAILSVNELLATHQNKFHHPFKRIFRFHRRPLPTEPAQLGLTSSRDSSSARYLILAENERKLSASRSANRRPNGRYHATLTTFGPLNSRVICSSSPDSLRCSARELLAIECETSAAISPLPTEKVGVLKALLALLIQPSPLVIANSIPSNWNDNQDKILTEIFPAAGNARKNRKL